MQFGYEYFCGANVVVEVEGMPLLEAAGFSMEIVERKLPLYGYSSRHFDAVARGQVIVQGSLVVNYVHQDYLFQAISLGIQEQSGATAVQTSLNTQEQLEDSLKNEIHRNELVKEMVKNYPENIRLAEALKSKYWDGATRANSPSQTELSLNPHDHFGGLDIKVTFGDRSDANDYSGKTGYLLSDVYFTGRGMPIRIDEDVIVEEYPFFARNVYTIRQPYFIRAKPATSGEPTIETVTVPNN